MVALRYSWCVEKNDVTGLSMTLFLYRKVLREREREKEGGDEEEGKG